MHSGGIFAALSATTAELAAEMMREAKAAGAVTSFDLNFREKLWKIHGGDKRAVETIAKIVENVDVLVGNEEDLQKGLGIPGPEVAAKSKLDPSVFFGMMDKVVKKHPHVKVVATTLREVHSTNRHSWSAVAWIDGKTYAAPTAELDVLDRVGGGDGFAAGFIYGLLSGEAPESRAEAGLGARRTADDFPRRHDDGDAGPGAGVREGRLGAHSALTCSQILRIDERQGQASIGLISLTSASRRGFRLAKVTLVFAVLLIALGLVGLLRHGQSTSTALIPTWFGLALGSVWVAGDEPQRDAAQAVHAHQRDDWTAGFFGGACRGGARLCACEVSGHGAGRDCAGVANHDGRACC